MVYVEGRFFITGTPGARDWYANVLDHPGITIHVAGWDLQATARVVSDVETRALVFDSPFTRWYASQSQPIGLIEEAPMIEIVF